MVNSRDHAEMVSYPLTIPFLVMPTILQLVGSYSFSNANLFTCNWQFVKEHALLIYVLEQK